MHLPLETCPNCGAPQHGRYCQECGQDNRRDRLMTRDWAGDFIDGLTNNNGASLRTVLELSWRPGAMIRNYVGGRRRSYLTPVRYALITSALWWLMVHLQIKAMPPEEFAKIDPGMQILLTYGQPLNLALVPWITLGIWLAHAGSKHTYAETLCFTLFTSGHLFLWRAGIAGLGGAFPGHDLALTMADQIFALVYIVAAQLGFYRSRLVWRILRSLLGMVLLLVLSGLGMQAVTALATR